jgi:hypothetical protein
VEAEAKLVVEVHIGLFTAENAECAEKEEESEPEIRN